MKKQFFLHKLGVFPLMILFCSANAQTDHLNANLNTNSSKEVELNANFIEKEVPAFYNNSRLTTRVIKNFSKNFKEAGNDVAWFEAADGLRAQFTNDGIQTKVFYDLKGRWIANVRAYQEDKLPKDIRHGIKSIYYDYSIFHVQEITVSDKTAYLVKMEDKNSIKTIRVAGGEMNEYLAMEKSK